MADKKTPDFLGTGRRKTAVARVRLSVGSGKFVVNGKPMETYFPTETLRGVVTSPLTVTENAAKYDVHINVVGGGPAGQAGAVRHGISRALLEVDVNLRPTLKSNGCSSLSKMRAMVPSETKPTVLR